MAALLLEVVPADAVFHPGPPARRPAGRTTTQLVVRSFTPGQSVTGFIANENNPFDPRTGYPVANPGAPNGPPGGWSAHNIGFAGVINAEPVGGGALIHLYCIDIRTATRAGYGYELGSWEESGMPNLGYVARLLNDYYPNTGAPTTVGNNNQRAAAVQAAIWFFTDNYVLSTSGNGNVRPAVEAIVANVLRQGPLETPPPPSLAITPTSHSGHVHVLGPYTVTTNHLPVTVTATGGTMYSNAAGTTQLGNGTTATLHHSPEDVWLRLSAGNTSDIAELQATSTATVPSGNVYLWDRIPVTPGQTDAQRLILAAPATLTTTVKATAEFKPFGKLVVKKTISGPAAGSQGKVVIRVKCDDYVRRPDFVIPAGTRAGTKSRTYHKIAAGTTCKVTETSNGSTTTTTVEVRGDGQEVTIPRNGTKTVEIKDIYRFVPGSLLVRKTIAGPAASKQGEVVIRVECNGKHLTPDFMIPAKTPAGEHTKQYDGIPVPAKCTVTETVDGHTSAVSVVVEGSGQTVSVGPGEIVEADISDTYGLVPGQLEVNKTIDGPLAGHQGEVVIHTVCNGTPLTPDFVILPGATGVQSHIYSGIPTPATCVVTETVDGATSTVSVEVMGSPDTVTIRPGGSGAATIYDTYGARPGSLLVTKTISGPRAGHQGPITIHVVCNGIALSPDFVIDAGAPAGTVSHSFDDIPAGSVCMVNETADGATATVIVTVSGNGQSVTIPAGKVASVSVMDAYDDGSPVTPEPEEPGSPSVDATGSVTVTKTIAGPAARHHGRIAILVACGGPVFDFTFVIPAHTGPGSVTRHFDNIPSGSRCQVTETENGHTNTVAVAARGSRTVTIPATGGVTVHITDRFTVKPVTPPPPIVTG